MILTGIINDNNEYYNFSLEIIDNNSPWYIEFNDNKLLFDEQKTALDANYSLLIKDSDNNIICSLDNNNSINPIELLQMLDNLNCSFNLTDVILNDLEKDILPVANEFDYILSNEYEYNSGWDLFNDLLNGLCSENFIIDIERLFQLYLNSSSFYDMFLKFELQFYDDPDDANISNLIAHDLIETYVNLKELKKESA